MSACLEGRCLLGFACLLSIQVERDPIALLNFSSMREVVALKATAEYVRIWPLPYTNIVEITISPLLDRCSDPHSEVPHA